MKYYIKIALQHLAMGIIIPISIVWKTQNGLSVTEAVLTESIVLLVTAIADLPAGFIANSINNKRSLVVGAFMHLIGVILLLFGGSLTIFILAAICTGIAWAFVSGADEAYLHDDYIEDKSLYRKHFSTVTIVDEVFTIVGMLLTSMLISLDVNLRTLFVLASVLLFTHFLYTWIFLPVSRAKLPSTHPVNLTSTFSLTILKNKKVMALLPLMIAFAVIYEAGRPLWQPQLQNLGVNIASFGLVFALFKLSSIGGSLLSRGRYFKKRDLILIFMIMLVSLVSFGLPFKIIGIVALCVYLFTENYFRVYMSTVLNESIVENRAAVLSFGSVIRNATGALIIAGTGLISSTSILLALFVLAIIKLPAIVYTLRAYKVSAQ
jgi:MFS family permease